MARYAAVRLAPTVQNLLARRLAPLRILKCSLGQCISPGEQKMKNPVLLFTFVLFASTTAAFAASDLSGKCEARKLTAAGKYAYCRMAVEAGAAQRGSALDYTACEKKFGRRWENAEFGGACPTN